MPPIRSLLLSLLQKRFLQTTSSTLSPTSPLPTISSSSSFTVQYLINSCGLPLQSALSASRNVQLNENNLQNPQSVLEFLKSHDFNHTHITKLIQKRPVVLHCRVKSNLKPKFDFFIKIGFVGHLLPELIERSLDSYTKPSFEFLQTFLGSNEKIVAAVKRDRWLLMVNFKGAVQPNIDFLIKEGVPVDRVAKLFVWEPRVITLKHDKMVYTVNAVKDMGIEPKSPMFIHAVRVMRQMSKSTWKKKIEVMKNVGWSEEEILLVFKRYPLCLSCSGQKIRTATDFLVNTMNLGLQTMIQYPILLKYAIDKRLRPRCNVLRVLQSKKLIKEDRKIEPLLLISEKKFLEKFVTRYVDKLPGLLEIYGVPPRQEKS